MTVCLYCFLGMVCGLGFCLLLSCLASGAWLDFICWLCLLSRLNDFLSASITASFCFCYQQSENCMSAIFRVFLVLLPSHSLCRLSSSSPLLRSFSSVFLLFFRFSSEFISDCSFPFLHRLKAIVLLSPFSSPLPGFLWSSRSFSSVLSCLLGWISANDYDEQHI